jgi:hypothetical protein
MASSNYDDITFFTRTDFRNDGRVFGIKTEDRFSHVYVIGKTGTGKSTLMETMALQDLRRGAGFVLIDPHGDLVGGSEVGHQARSGYVRGMSVHFPIADTTPRAANVATLHSITYSARNRRMSVNRCRTLRLS